MLKPLNQQVLFVTGVSSTLSLATLRTAVAAGTKVFMVSKNERELEKLQAEMKGQGHTTAYAVADISEIDQLEVAADQCLTTFGAIDTWINFSGGDELTERETFDSNFWGIVNGCKVAVETLKTSGGSLINVANNFTEGHLDRAFKQALRGYTESLRKELQNLKVPMTVSLITIDENRKLESPEETSEKILKCAEVATREMKITSQGRVERFVKKFQTQKLGQSERGFFFLKKKDDQTQVN